LIRWLLITLTFVVGFICLGFNLPFKYVLGIAMITILVSFLLPYIIGTFYTIGLNLINLFRKK